MNARNKNLLVAACLTVMLSGPAGSTAQADDFSVHGSISVTASDSDTVDYLGDTKDTLNLNLVDVILNSTHRFDNGLRVGGQVYAYKLGDYQELTLDFANADYSFCQQFGVRLGRNKLPHGLYNDSQDLDAIRTFASLPFSFYPRPLRAVDASFDGISLYGTLGLSRAGSLDYQVYAGAKEALSDSNLPLLRGISSSLIQFDKWQFGQGVQGASLFWNLPVDGLKVGYSIQRLPNTTLSGVLGTTSTLSGGDLALADRVDEMLGQGAWDYSGSFAGTPATVSGVDILFRTLSAEYTTGKWVFAAEYKLIDELHGTTTIPALALLGQPTTSPYSANLDYYYGMVSYQATDKIGLGYYYAGNCDDRKGSAASRSNPADFSKDNCVAVSYNLTKWCVVKAEYHFMDGFTPLGLSGDPRPASTADSKWHYVVLKTTISF